MAPIAVGDSVPEGTLAWFDETDQLQQLSFHSLAAGKKVVLFGVPGAFTPTCSMQHVPGFIGSAEELKSKGVEEILCISGIPIPEKLQVATILNSLPNSFDMVTTSMRSNPSLQLSELPARLGIEQDIMFSRRKQELNVEEANFVHRKLKKNKDHNRGNAPYKAQFKSNQSQLNKPRGSYHLCGRLATIEQIVQIRIEIKAMHQNRKQIRVFIGVVECNNIVAPSSNDWWVDSDATRYIAKTKKGLEFFKEIKSGKQRIYMGNNTWKALALTD